MFKFIQKIYATRELAKTIIKYYGNSKPKNNIELQYLFNYQNRNDEIFNDAVKRVEKFWSSK